MKNILSMPADRIVMGPNFASFWHTNFRATISKLAKEFNAVKFTIVRWKVIDL